MVVNTDAAAAVSALSSAVRQLRVVSDGLVDAAADVRSLVALVNWQAKSAVVFHDRAQAWAAGVTALDCVIDAARASALRGQSRAAFDADLERLRG